MTSSYLERPLRSEAEAMTDQPDAAPTLGPWTIDSDEPTVVEIPSDRSGITYAAYTGTKANARLIAAAPATAAERDRLLEHFERLRDAISDNLPGLSAIDDGTWHEHTGDLVLKEEQWNAIVVATCELRMALAGGEARAVLDEANKS